MEQNKLAKIQTTNSISPLNTLIDTLKDKQQGVKLSEATDKQLADELFKVYNIIGLRVQHYPNEIQDQLIFRYLRQYYGNRFLNELLLAFELAIFGRYEVEVNPYDQFSIAYMVNILEAYRKYTKEIIMSEVKKEEIKQLPTREMTEQEMKEELESYRHRENLNLRLIPYYLYDYMVRLNICKENEWEQYSWKACMYRKNELYLKAENNGDRDAISEYGKFCKMLEPDPVVLEGAEKMIVTSIAKKIHVYKYLQSK